MVASATSVPRQTGTGTPGNGTATPGVGPEELVEFAPTLVRWAWFLLGATVVLVVGLLVVEPLISRTVRRRNRDNPTVQDAIARYVRVFVVAVAVVVGAGMAGLANVLTSSALVVAAATLAVGVAAQTVVGSLVSGLVLVFDPEFSVGNYIEWEGGEGTVEAITLRVTRVENPDGALVTVPNTVLTNGAITRPFGRGRYRVVDRVGVDYADDPERAIEILESVARGLDGVAERPEPEAFVDELADGVVQLRAHFWLEDARHPEVFETRSAFARRVRRRFDEADITISPASEHELSGRVAVDDDR